MKTNLVQIQSIINQHANASKTETGIPRVFIVKGKIPEHELSGMYEPMINLVVQGSKTLTVGKESLHYGPSTYFVMSIDVPAIGAINQEKNGSPYLSVNLYIDPTQLSELIELENIDTSSNKIQKAFSVVTMTSELYDAWFRMLQLLERPEDIPVLSPMIEREILYRVLKGPQGWMLREIAQKNSSISKMRKAMSWIKKKYKSKYKIEELAKYAGMSSTTFFRKFKSVTGMTPIQYQKQMRLLEARRMMIQNNANVTEAALEVGFESISQFSREYNRFFGLSPLKDISKIKNAN